MERRLLLRLIAAGFLAQRAPQGLVSIAGAQQAVDDYKPAFFTPAEMRTLDAFTEILIPADDHSGGARAALVPRYIDVLASEAGEVAQQEWRERVAMVDDAARVRFGRSFGDCEEPQQLQIVARMAAGEENPLTELERCFRSLKSVTIDGYYTSKLGIHDELEYEGNTALAEFPGCTHPEHQA